MDKNYTELTMKSRDEKNNFIINNFGGTIIIQVKTNNWKEVIYNLKYYLKIIAYLASVDNNNQIFMFFNVFFMLRNFSNF